VNDDDILTDQTALTELSYEELVARLAKLRDRRNKAANAPRSTPGATPKKRVKSVKDTSRVASDAAWDDLLGDGEAEQSASDMLDDMTKE
jgi:hypothetical protein